MSGGHPEVSTRPFGVLPDGRGVQAVTLRSGGAAEVEVLTYGGIVRAFRVRDVAGKETDIVLGFDTLDEYLGPHPYFGGLIGRCANRIAHGRFALDGKEYVLARNDPPNHLHGGERGFDRVLWNAEGRADRDAAAVILRHVSPDGDEGYPGRLRCEVTYALTTANEFIIDYEATTDRPTIVNLTHHSYFNLGGGAEPTVLDHELQVDAPAFLPVDAHLIPEGSVTSVEGTPFDLRAPARIGAIVQSAHPQIVTGSGLDHNFILDRWAGKGSAIRRVARLFHPATGHALEVSTTEPGLQVYTGGVLDGTLKGKAGVAYRKYAGICLETQAFPDTPNRPEWPSVRLDAEGTYRSRTVYTFSTNANRNVRG